ncbi:MAG TPA: four helix bundle protein [Chitinophagaceae bacterium]|nr:four helix bundle protein [Chitinophagaceae bacterium]
MNRYELQQWTKKFNVDIIRFCSDFPRTPAGFEIAKRLIRAAGSVGANYRATVRAKSRKDFIYKIQIVLEEADESLYWLEIVKQAGIRDGEMLELLLNEANQLTAIFAATDKSAKSSIKNRQIRHE